MTHIRTQKNKNYTVINNTIATDKRLSWKAKGIFLYAMSRPDDWRFHVNDLINQGLDGRDSVRAGLKELEAAGYLKRSKVHGPDGKFSDDEWILYEEPMELKEKVPQTGFPAQANPATENPALGNPPLLSTKYLPNTEKTTTTTYLVEDRSVVVVSCEILNKIIEFQQKAISSWGELWNIHSSFISELISKFGAEYVKDQYLYMAGRQKEFWDKRNDPSAKVKSAVDKPRTYLKLSCENNWAESLKKKVICG